MPRKDLAERKKYHQEYMREHWYPQNRQKHIEFVRAARAKRLVEFARQKVERGCDICKHRESAKSLDYHHRPGTIKLFNISEGVRRFGAKRVQDEIAKCDLLCANCHRATY